MNKKEQERRKFARKLDEALDAQSVPPDQRANILAKHFEISARAAYKWLNGESMPAATKISELAALVGKTVNYFYGDDGEICEGEEFKNPAIITIGSAADTKHTLIKFYGAKAACGTGYENGSDEDLEQKSLAFTETWLREHGLPPDGEGLVCIKADGDSMKGEVNNGATILVNTKEIEYDQLLNGKIYVFKNGTEMICKRVRRNLDGSVTLVSNNADKQNYPDVDLNAEKFADLNVFGRARWVASTL